MVAPGGPAPDAGPPSPVRRKRGRQGDAARISWPIWAVMFGGFGLITGILLWFGALIVVRCDRVVERQVTETLETRDGVTVPVQRVVQEGRVDVTVEQRLLGLISHPDGAARRRRPRERRAEAGGPAAGRGPRRDPRTPS